MKNDPYGFVKKAYGWINGFIKIIKHGWIEFCTDGLTKGFMVEESYFWAKNV